MRVMGLDPGSTESSVVRLSEDGRAIEEKLSAPNARVREWLHAYSFEDVLAVEFMRPRGMPTSQDEIDTCVELGRMIEAWGGPYEKVSRLQAKMHVCGRANATDANIRQALIDVFGGEAAIGGKRCQGCGGKGWVGRDHAPCALCRGSTWRMPPGPLRDVRGDEWAALSIAITARARLNGETRA